MTKLIAIQTEYKGYLYRSRLEAKWAKFFDSLSVEYTYEPQGFWVDGQRYLPDFYLPGLNTYVEVKPKRFSNSASLEFKSTTKQLQAFASTGDHSVWLVCGDPWDVLRDAVVKQNPDRPLSILFGFCEDEPVYAFAFPKFCSCPEYPKDHPKYRPNIHPDSGGWVDPDCYTGDAAGGLYLAEPTDAMTQAALAARKERFERHAAPR